MSRLLLCLYIATAKWNTLCVGLGFSWRWCKRGGGLQNTFPLNSDNNFAEYNHGSPQLVARKWMFVSGLQSIHASNRLVVMCWMNKSYFMLYQWDVCGAQFDVLVPLCACHLNCLFLWSSSKMCSSQRVEKVSHLVNTKWISCSIYHRSSLVGKHATDLQRTHSLCPLEFTWMHGGYILHLYLLLWQ